MSDNKEICVGFRIDNSFIDTGINDNSKIIGCYVIKHIRTGKIYIGSSSDCKRRKSQHLSDLRHNCHDNKELQKDYNNSPDIIFNQFIRFNTHEEALDFEQEMLNLSNSRSDLKPKLYNYGIDTRSPNKGLSPSEETRAKLRKANLGKTASFATRFKMSISNKYSKRFKGKIHSNSTKIKISKALKGRCLSEDRKLKLIKATKKAAEVCSKPIMINNIKYKSAAEASRILNIDHTTISWRLHSLNFPNYIFIEKDYLPGII